MVHMLGDYISRPSIPGTCETGKGTCTISPGKGIQTTILVSEHIIGKKPSFFWDKESCLNFVKTFV